ncbi:MAG: O-antigen ligase family protein [Syntrophaceae bacterium]
MSCYLMYLTVFIMFFQPTSIFPWMEAAQPLRNAAIIAFIAYLFAAKKSSHGFMEINTNRFFVLFAVMQVISSAFVWLTGAVETLNLWIRIGIVYFLITQLVTDEKKVRMVALMMVLGLAYLSYFSISNYVVDYIPGLRAGAFGWYENPNDLAIILVTAIPLALLLANTSTSFLGRLLYMALAAMFTFNVLFTGSRNGLLGLMAVGVIGIMSSYKIPKLLRSCLIIGLLGAVLTVGVSNVLTRSDLQGHVSGDESSESRIEQWKAGARMLVHNPLFGIGREQFPDRASDYGGIHGMYPHNTLVQVFSETGLPGGIFFVMFAVYPLYEARRYFQRPRKKTPVLSAVGAYRFIIAALVGFWACAFFSNRYQYYILYVLVALVVAIKENIIKPQESTDADIPLENPA